MLLQCACSQEKVFENSIIKFSYPAEYTEVKPQNAPHMILNIESNNSIFTISKWEYDIDESIDVWNDNIYNRYRNGLPGTNCVLSEKVILQTKYENLRAIKIYTNLEDNGNKVGSITYLFIKSGNLFVITYNQPMVLTSQSSSKVAEKFLYPLLIKNNAKTSKKEPSMSIEEFENYIIEKYKDVNKTLPMKVDEITTLFGVMNMGKTLFFKYRIDSKYADYINNEWAIKYKEQTLLNMMSSIPNSEEFATYMSRSSIKMTYLIFDNKDNLIRTIHITPKDFEL